MYSRFSPCNRNAYTLVELAIVLVVVGFVVGAVLIGHDLLRSSQTRSALAQIERYQHAVSVFRAKYNALPGDMNASLARTYGFAPRGAYAGEGDGDGVIEGVHADAARSNCGVCESAGETVLFWVDLSASSDINENLIGKNFVAATAANVPDKIAPAELEHYFPVARLGSKNYFYVYSKDRVNYFGLSAIGTVQADGVMRSIPMISAEQAYSIDRKIDDGYPQSGEVTAQYVNGGQVIWAGPADTSAATPAVSGCYDNNNEAGAPQHYSVSANGDNCALSFRFH